MIEGLYPKFISEKHNPSEAEVYANYAPGFSPQIVHYNAAIGYPPHTRLPNSAQTVIFTLYGAGTHMTTKGIALLGGTPYATHVTYSLQFAQMFRNERKEQKKIVVIRDPRDYISKPSRDFDKKSPNLQRGRTQVFNIINDERPILGQRGIKENFALLKYFLYHTGVLFIKFEDLQNHQRAPGNKYSPREKTLITVGNHLGLPLNDAIIQNAANNLEGDTWNYHPGQHYGFWRRYFTRQSAQLFSEYCGPIVSELGYATDENWFRELEDTSILDVPARLPARPYSVLSATTQLAARLRTGSAQPLLYRNYAEESVIPAPHNRVVFHYGNSSSEYIDYERAANLPQDVPYPPEVKFMVASLPSSGLCSAVSAIDLLGPKVYACYLFHSIHLAQLQSNAFDHVKKIILVSDPRNFWCQHNPPWFANNTLPATHTLTGPFRLQEWVAYATSFSGIPNAKFVRIEDLLDNSIAEGEYYSPREKTLIEIGNFFDLCLNDTIIFNAASNMKIYQEPHVQVAERALWRQYFSINEAQKFTQEFGPIVSQLGYESNENWWKKLLVRAQIFSNVAGSENTSPTSQGTRPQQLQQNSSPSIY